MEVSIPRQSATRGAPTVWRILVVENNDEDAEPLMRGLQRYGHHVERVSGGIPALDAYDGVDLVLLDLELPDLDGLEVCRQIRAAGDTAVIAVTARGAELDRVLGLQAGADDYLVKPYGFQELLARMEAVMRRVQMSTADPSLIVRGPLCIDAAARQVSLDGRRVEVTRKEFDLLYLLAVQPDNVVSRKAIMQAVWGDVWSRRTIDTHISSLRGKLGSSDWIRNVRGVGFQLGCA
ncbi:MULTISPECIES: response regulator transcription factor [unclassified Streptomyces]|uniref:response regulator transcription factor n=1 Tax=unclassified Streptomyces TaxID=2593676 RepID=UPI002E15A344|nr:MULTISPECIES: response regulator transcription factor [unclassified Streptomyces]WSR21612.1 response regulator transcription factor [Streptomyces sp. NBC_01205]